MATVNSREIVDQIIAGNGYYMGDPLVIRIVSYENMFNGGTTYGLIYQGEDPWRYHKADACSNVQTIFEHDSAKGRPPEAVREEM